MIKLTFTDSKYTGDIWIPENVVVLEKFGNAYIRFPDGEIITVSESPEEVVRKIMDYKLAMVRYEAASKGFAASGHTDMTAMNDYAENDLNKLAGLEQTP